jgi:hypothetical protein
MHISKKIRYKTNYFTKNTHILVRFADIRNVTVTVVTSVNPGVFIMRFSLQITGG